MSKPTCPTCKFFSALQGKVCFRYPPAALVVSQPGKVQVMSAFPPVQDTHWCGEHQPDEAVVALAS